LQYTLMIPAEETGLRRFCLWAIGLAVLTLRNIYRNPAFNSGAEVKVKRRVLKMTIGVSNLCCRHNYLLEFLFQRLTRELV
jgi:farnesyl-diphosphate farnesyltransferase